MNENIIELSNISFKYDDAAKNALDGISLEVKKGEFLCVLGRNGSGKSTLAKLFNALILPTGGNIRVFGIEPRDDDSAFEVRTHCGMVFQNPDNQIVATIVEEDCAFGLENLGVEPKEIRARVDAALKTVGMSEFAEKAPHMLSGGQKQRVAVAGVVAMRPEIIIFDESTAMLDPVGRRDIFDLAKKLNKEENITIVWITHFMEEAAASDRLIVMSEGKIVSEGTPDKVFSDPEKIRSLGLDVPEMAYLAELLNKKGIPAGNGICSIQEMAERLCRSK